MDQLFKSYLWPSIGDCDRISGCDGLPMSNIDFLCSMVKNRNGSPPLRPYHKLGPHYMHRFTYSRYGCFDTYTGIRVYNDGITKRCITKLVRYIYGHRVNVELV